MRPRFLLLFRRAAPSLAPPRRLAGIAALLAFALACVGPPQPSVEEQQQFDAAVVVSASNPDEAARRLEAFLQQYQTSRLAEEAAERRADLALAVGDRAKASFWLRWLVRNHPDGQRSDEARVELARLAFQEGDVETVAWALADVRVDRLSPARKRLSFRLRAETETDPVEQLRWLAKSRSAAAEAAVQPEALALIDAELARHVDLLSALDLLRAAERLDGRVPAARVGLRLAALNMDAGDWEGAADEMAAAEDLELGESEAQILAELQLRLEYHESGGAEKERLPSFASVAEDPMPSVDGAAGTIAAVLPLSGPYASYGEESLRGVLLAAGLFDPVPELDPEAELQPLGEPLPSQVRARQSAGEAGIDAAASATGADASPEPALRVVVYDSSGAPERAAQAVRASAADDDVVAIVGPVRSRACKAAAAVADELGIPLLALSTREEIARDTAYAFRMRMTPEDELRYLVDYAFDEQGVRQFAILHPDDGYGRGMRDHFWRMVVERGGWVVAVSAYPPGATDFGDPIRQMIGYPLLTSGEHVALAEREAFLRRSRRLPPDASQLAQHVARDLLGPEAEPLPPIVDFDALFIPDGYENIGLIAPQLAFHDVGGVQLLGVGDWMHPDLMEIARQHVDGAVISSQFDAESRFPFVADLVDGYRRTFDAEPDVFAAQAYDAANLVLAQLATLDRNDPDPDRIGRDARIDVRDGILRVRAFPGASGVTSVAPDGNARKRPFLIEVTRSGFAPLD